MPKPGLSDNEQKIHDGAMGILDDLVESEGGIVTLIYAGIRPRVSEEVARFVDQLQSKDD